MLRRWLVDLRKKPKHVRERVALISASSFTAVVFIGWLLASPWQVENEAAAVESGPKLFSTFISQIKEAGGIKDSLPPLPEPATTPEAAPAPVVLSASSTNWSLSSTTVDEKRIGREVPIIVVPSSSSSVTASTAPSAI